MARNFKISSHVWYIDTEGKEQLQVGSGAELFQDLSG